MTAKPKPTTKELMLQVIDVLTNETDLVLAAVKAKNILGIYDVPRVKKKAKVKPKTNGKRGTQGKRGAYGR